MDTDMRDDFEQDAQFFSDMQPPINAPASTAVEERPQEEAEPVFPPEVTQDVQGMLFLGALSKKFELFGHRFEVRTLKAGEELAVAQVAKDYEGNVGAAKAFGIATVAACLVTVDGRPLTRPLGPEDTISAIRQNFDYIARGWYYPVVEMVYDHYADLILRQNAVFLELQGKSAAGRPQS